MYCGLFLYRDEGGLSTGRITLQGDPGAVRGDLNCRGLAGSRIKQGVKFSRPLVSVVVPGWAQAQNLIAWLWHLFDLFGKQVRQRDVPSC